MVILDAPDERKTGMAPPLTVVDRVAHTLRAEGVEFLSAYPTTPMIDAAARAGIRPVVCRQERVGVGIADGFSRIAAPSRFGVFACQFGPGIENSFSGIASAYSDGIPILVLPLGNSLDRLQLHPQFRSCEALCSVSKQFETILRPDDVDDVMRRAFSALRNGVTGPVVVEIPSDVATAPVEGDTEYEPVGGTRCAADPAAVAAAVDELAGAKAPLIVAGHGVLRAAATAELVALAEHLAIPVVTTLAGKSAFPERHPLSVGVGTVVATDAVVNAVNEADTVLVVGSSLSRHFLALDIPAGARLLHATSDARDLHKTRRADEVLLGDAQLVLRQLVEGAREREAQPRANDDTARRIAADKAAARESWRSTLESEERPLTPYRVITEFMAAMDPDEVIVTHDSGSPRDQIAPWYVAGGPNTYIGWGKSHALGGGLGLTIGAKLAAPDKVAVHFHGDAAFGMTGLDIETAARCDVPIVSVVLNNSTMAIETTTLVDSQAAYGTRDIAGDYSALATALGVASRQVHEPEELGGAFRWAAERNREGRSVLLEVITSSETRFVNRHVLNSPASLHLPGKLAPTRS
jgi:acetolactate synthase-1/2/3 large subunit